MRLFPSKADCCEATVTKETAVMPSLRNGTWKRAKMVFHYRAEDEAYFWHWSDQEVERSP